MGKWPPVLDWDGGGAFVSGFGSKIQPNGQQEKPRNPACWTPPLCGFLLSSHLGSHSEVGREATKSQKAGGQILQSPSGSTGQVTHPLWEPQFASLVK